MKCINLTKNQVAIVDDEDYDWLTQMSWYVKSNQNTIYAQHSLYKEKTTIKMHRLIYERYFGKIPDGYCIDHIDHNGLNNQKSNLRLATPSQKCHNMRKTHGSSKFKGVGWHKVRKKWRAYIEINGGQKLLGLFDDELEAAKAYDATAREIFGEFACLNFPADKPST